VIPSAVETNSQTQPNGVRKRTLALKLSPAAAVAMIAAVLSLFAFLYFFANGMTNVYGDGVAHVNIARKVVDSPDDLLWQRYMQIGSPWLPLQTVAIMPLVANDWMWRTGVAGSIVSMISFIIAAVALYLLAGSFYRKEGGRWGDALPALSAAKDDRKPKPEACGSGFWFLIFNALAFKRQLARRIVTAGEICRDKGGFRRVQICCN